VKQPPKLMLEERQLTYVTDVRRIAEALGIPVTPNQYVRLADYHGTQLLVARVHVHVIEVMATDFPVAGAGPKGRESDVVSD
jgi:hypothetical protein